MASASGSISREIASEFSASSIPLRPEPGTQASIYATFAPLERKKRSHKQGKIANPTPFDKLSALESGLEELDRLIVKGGGAVEKHKREVSAVGVARRVKRGAAANPDRREYWDAPRNRAMGIRLDALMLIEERRAALNGSETLLRRDEVATRAAEKASKALKRLYDFFLKRAKGRIKSLPVDHWDPTTMEIREMCSTLLKIARINGSEKQHDNAMSLLVSLEDEVSAKRKLRASKARDFRRTHRPKARKPKMARSHAPVL